MAGSRGRGGMVVTIGKDGSVVLDPDTPAPGRGRLDGNRIEATYPARSTDSQGVSCKGSIPVTGIITGGHVEGSIGPATFRCNGIPFTTSGTYRLTRFAGAPVSASTIGETLDIAARKAARI